jgi:hypothetical protein
MALEQRFCQEVQVVMKDLAFKEMRFYVSNNTGFFEEKAALGQGRNIQRMGLRPKRVVPFWQPRQELG